MNLNKSVITRNKTVRHLLLTLLSALLFSIPFMGIAIPTQLIGFVPLLFIADDTSNKWKFMGWWTVMIIVWTVTTTLWITNAAVIGIYAATIVTLVLFFIPMLSFFVALKKTKRSLAYTLLVSSWIGFEYIYLFNEQVSHPWLIIGNAFAVNTEFVQWYEYTGALGGSLWALVTSCAVYETWRHRSKRGAIASALIIVVPIVISLIRYFNYKESVNPIKVAIVQPNIDPYKDKFGGMSYSQQAQLIKNIIKTAPKDVDYIVAPETAINDNINIDKPLNSYEVNSLQSIMREEYPQSELIIGATMYKFYPEATEPPTYSARKLGRNGDNGYYDAINGSMQIDANSVESYIKSRLVIGVEMIPFPDVTKYILSIVSVDLGGISGALLTQPDREVFVNNIKKDINGNPIKISAPICYESIYGEFIGGFVRMGADAIFVITNDGWWKETFGYKQHFSYSRLRAIEQRRSIARSANTGISGFINQRGDVVDKLGWYDKRNLLVGEINLNEKRTFYAIFGDLLGRIGLYVYIISMLYMVSYIYKKKGHLES